MKRITVSFLVLVLICGCKAMDSLIFHPVHVLVEQHKNNQNSKWNEEHAWINWPTNTP